MACVVPCIILVNNMMGAERFFYAAARIIETVVGVVIALAVLLTNLLLDLAYGLADPLVRYGRG